MTYLDVRAEFLADLRAGLLRVVIHASEYLSDEELSPEERHDCVTFVLAMLENLHDEFVQMIDPEYRPSSPEFQFPVPSHAYRARVDSWKPSIVEFNRQASLPPGFGPATKLDEFQFEKAAARVGRRKRRLLPDLIE